MSDYQSNIIPDQIQERWLPVDGFEGYDVSNFGRVRSYRRPNGADPANGGHIPGGLFIASTPQKILRPLPTNGYHRVCLFSDGKRFYIQIHRLVLTAFVGPCPPGQECCHEDRNRSNNRLTNLRWDTRSANTQDSINHGTHASLYQKGIHHAQAILTESQVLKIRELYAHGLFQKDIGQMFGLVQSHVSDIVRRRIWKQVP